MENKVGYIRLAINENNKLQVENSKTCWYDKKDFIGESCDGCKFYKAIAGRSGNAHEKYKPITFFEEGICYFIELGEKCTNESYDWAKGVLFYLLMAGTYIEACIKQENNPSCQTIELSFV